MNNSKNMNLKEKVSHGNFILPMKIYRGEFNNNANSYLHWHPEMEIIYIKSGTGTLYINLNTLPINSGDIILIQKEAIHYILGDINVTLKYEVIVFDLSILQNSALDYSQINFLDPLTNNLLKITPIIKLDDLGYYSIVKLINKVINTYDEKRKFYQLQIKGLLFSLLFELFSNNYITKSILSNIDNNKKLNKIKKVIEYIYANYNNSISNKELSLIANYSEFHFIRFFKTQTGKSCSEFINAIRLEKSLSLLANSSASITEIAFDVGFNDVSYFIKVFKRNFNTSPNKYRKFIEL